MMGLFDKIKEPVVLKEDSSAAAQLHDLEELLAITEDAKVKSMLENDIAALKAGIFGEDTILFELKNSHIPMFVLHDLYLEHEGLTAQIDFLIITRRRQFVVECKNLYGNITINNAGDFIRVTGTRKEGIYSPVTQGKRHLELIKQIRCEEKENILAKSLFERYFYESYRSVVVLANPKTILNAKYATKEVKNQVIRADQLSAYIRRVNQEQDASDMREKDMEQLAYFFLSNHRICKTDYLEKYRIRMQSEPGKGRPEQLRPESEKYIEAGSSEPEQKKAGRAELPQPGQEKKEKIVLPHLPCPSVPPSGSGDDWVPQCPTCGLPMVKRVAARGSNAGKEFWGCSGYPKCRGIVNISAKEGYP